MKGFLIQTIQTSIAEWKYISTSIPILLVLFGGNVGYGILYNYMYNPNIVKKSTIAVVDMSHSKISSTFIQHLDATEQVNVEYVLSDYAEGEKLVKERKIAGFLYIPKSFSLLGIEDNRSNIMAYGSTLSFLDFLMLQEATTYTLLDFNDMLRPLYVMQLSDKQKFAIANMQRIQVVPTVMYNPTEGYGTYLMPPVMIIILFQTLLICISSSCGNEVETKLLHINKIYPHIQCKGSTTVMGKVVAYTTIYFVFSFFLLGLLPSVFNLPNIGNATTIMALVVPFLFSSSCFALCFLPLYNNSEKPLLFIVFMSIILLFFSGISYPLELMPWYWKIMHYVFPSATAAMAFVKINSMGATLSDIRPEMITLCIQCAVYFIAAIFIYNKAIKKKIFSSKTNS